MKPSTDIVKIMALGTEVETLEWGQYGHIVKMDLVSINLFFFIPIYDCLKLNSSL